MGEGAPKSVPNLSAFIQTHRDPHCLYDAAREHGGVSWDEKSRAWLVTGHVQVRSLLDDSRLTSALPAANSASNAQRPSFIQAAVQRQIIFCDGEHQRRVQRVILRESAAKVQEMESHLRSFARELVTGIRARGCFDLVGEFSLPFTLEAIALVVGVPADNRSQLVQLAQWATTYADVTSGHLRGRIEDISLLGKYFRSLVAQKRECLSKDLISAFIREQTFEDDEDLVINAMMAFAAGRVTTQKLLVAGVPVLLPNWTAWVEARRRDPAVLKRLTEELLRVVTPTRYVVRYAKHPIVVDDGSADGQLIRPGQKVFLFLEAANRDRAAFPRPDELLTNRYPNPHVAFGFGSHRCPGASIARNEILIALDALLDSLPALRPDSVRMPTWEENPNIGGFKTYFCECA